MGVLVQDYLSDILFNEFKIMDHFKACQDVYFLEQGHYMREFLLNLFTNMDSFEITKNINAINNNL